MAALTGDIKIKLRKIALGLRVKDYAHRDRLSFRAERFPMQFVQPRDGLLERYSD